VYKEKKYFERQIAQVMLFIWIFPVPQLLFGVQALQNGDYLYSTGSQVFPSRKIVDCSQPTI
jgi:hypothetical protein